VFLSRVIAEMNAVAKALMRTRMSDCCDKFIETILSAVR
jgi:hypothetical protein